MGGLKARLAAILELSNLALGSDSPEDWCEALAIIRAIATRTMLPREGINAWWDWSSK